MHHAYFSQGKVKGSYLLDALGLTTGHGTCMPDAWGADEFISSPRGEWGRSGVTGNTSTSSMYENPPLSGVDNNGVSGLPGRYAGNNLIPLPVNGSLSLVDNATPYMQDRSAAEGLIPAVTGFTAPAGE